MNKDHPFAFRQNKAKTNPIKPNFRAVQTQTNPISARADPSNKYLFPASQAFTGQKLMPKAISLSKYQ